jgi:hypothetical protein
MQAGLARKAIIAAMTGSFMAIAACAPPPAPPAPAPAPAPAPVPAPAPMVMPTPPNSAATNLVIPTMDALGRRMTPNVDLSPEQALWQLRIGLNVAALSCRGPDEVVLVNNYSTFLRSNQRAIAAAERWVITDQGRRNGTNGIAQRDALSTRLYNYFAQPPVKTEFCARATQIMALAAVEPTANILTFASAQIGQLDQPFVDFYAAYDRYRSNFAIWQSQQPRPATTVGTTTVPPSTVAPPVGGAPASALPPAAQPAPVTPPPTTAPRPTSGRR